MLSLNISHSKPIQYNMRYFVNMYTCTKNVVVQSSQLALCMSTKVQSKPTVDLTSISMILRVLILSSYLDTNTRTTSRSYLCTTYCMCIFNVMHIANSSIVAYSYMYFVRCTSYNASTLIHVL